MDDAALRALYESAHCLAFPSRTEGFGLPPVEAMLCGCPVIAAPAGAIPEICRDTISYADVDDARGWAQTINSLQSEARIEKRACARNRGSNFQWSTSGAILANYIHQLI